MNENFEAHILAGIGLARGVAEEVREQVTIERVENAGLTIGVAGLAWALYIVIKQAQDFNDDSYGK